MFYQSYLNYFHLIEWKLVGRQDEAKLVEGLHGKLASLSKRACSEMKERKNSIFMDLLQHISM